MHVIDSRFPRFPLALGIAGRFDMVVAQSWSGNSPSHTESEGVAALSDPLAPGIPLDRVTRRSKLSAMENQPRIRRSSGHFGGPSDKGPSVNQPHSSPSTVGYARGSKPSLEDRRHCTTHRMIWGRGFDCSGSEPGRSEKMADR